jgi:sn-glycerol 3-phosphate transport system ATP-binding protein/multiple sugar transport system ATP-binding protein
MASVRVRQLTKRFGETPVLRGVDLDIASGQFCVLVGSSGCGKSTLLRCIAGLEAADSGEISFDDRDVTRLEPRERDIAMVFQSYALYPHLTVAENLAFGLRIRKAPAAEINARIQEASSLLGLDALLQRFPRELSGGQRQRVAMGRAIVRRPKVFLFDEPLSNLDAKLRGQVRVDIRKLHDRLEATSVYVTHDQVEAMTLADVMVVLDRGKVEQVGAPLDIYRAPASKFVGGFLGSPTMSFLSGKLSTANHVELAGGVVVNVAGVRSSDRSVDMGVRAEDLAVDDASSWRGEVEVVEALGSETFAHVHTEAGDVVLRLPAQALLRRGDRVGVSIAPEAVHLFDASDGKRIGRVGDKAV